MRAKREFMQTEWGLSENPFPSSAIWKHGEPFNPAVFPEETEALFDKIVAGGCHDNRPFAFVWSKSETNKDTGLSKTAHLNFAARAVNEDFNQTVMTDCGFTEGAAKKHRAIAAYCSFDNNSLTGIYPVLFNAVEYLADPEKNANGKSVFQMLREEIVEINDLEEDDSDGVEAAVSRARRRIGRTLPALRPELLEAFASGDPDQLSDVLASVSPTMRIRAGLNYLDFAVTVAEAAEVPHVFIFIDQLEDLATTPTVTKAKRVREVGRFRDIAAETKPFVGRTHFVFTFHDRAADALEPMWRVNRLPTFDAEDPAAEDYIVVLRGLKKPDQVKTLLQTYLQLSRGGKGGAEVFHASAYPEILRHANGRPGIVLKAAHDLVGRAAALGVKQIDAKFVQQILGTATPAARPTGRTRRSPDADRLSELLS